MKEKILQALKTKYSNLGLSAETLEGVANQLTFHVKEETEIEQAVAGVEPMLKAIQSEADKRAGKSLTETERLKKENQELAEKLKGFEGAPKEPGTPQEEIPVWAKTLTDKIGTLEASMNATNAEKTSHSFTEKLFGLLDEKGIPKSFYGATTVGRTFKEESEVQNLVEVVASQYETFKQDSANTGFSYTKPPEQGAPPKNESEAIADLINKGTKEIIENKN